MQWKQAEVIRENPSRGSFWKLKRSGEQKESNKISGWDKVELRLKKEQQLDEARFRVTSSSARTWSS